MYLKASIEAKINKNPSECLFRIYCFLNISGNFLSFKLRSFTILFCGIVSFSGLVEAQNHIPENLFIPPLDIPLTLSGNFGELRTNHFHSGIDFRTNGIQGLPVKASARGHISRIKVSSNGFGKVIYIDHPEGFTSVYAHLYRFSDSTERYIDSAQYANNSYEVELFPDSTRFPVIKGDIIGLSGNSGSSEGPHLHFEIRDRLSEEPLNPLFAGIQVKDTSAPILKNIFFYCYHNNIWEKTETKFDASKDSLTGDTSIIYLNTDTAGLAFTSFDPDSNSFLGIYSVELRADDSLVYKYSFDRFNFNETRFVNAHIDYQQNYIAKEKAERCFKLEGDSCSIFKNAGKGFFLIHDSIPVKLELLISDFTGNKILKKIIVQKKPKNIESKISKKQWIYTGKPFQFRTKEIEITIPAGAMYQNDYFTYEILNKTNKNKIKLITNKFQFMNGGVPFHRPVILKMKIENLNPSFKAKVLLVEFNIKSEIINTITCSSDHNWYQASIRAGGMFALTLDTVAPKLKNIDFVKDPVYDKTVLTAFITDDLSGIKSCSTFINNKWTLSAWDPRQHQLSIFPRGEIMGPNLLRIEVMDASSNKSQYETLY
jgi:murein DD-endopeptidase MepM/ murein hydrolase activator NlpD